MKNAMRAVKETESKEPTPEQLMQILDGELAVRRSHRTTASRNRAIILVFGLLFIVIAAGAALLVLDQMLTDLRPNGLSNSHEPAPSHTNF
jgi:hypothetical protein